MADWVLFLVCFNERLRNRNRGWAGDEFVRHFENPIISDSLGAGLVHAWWQSVENCLTDHDHGSSNPRSGPPQDHHLPLPGVSSGVPGRGLEVRRVAGQSSSHPQVSGTWECHGLSVLRRALLLARQGIRPEPGGRKRLRGRLCLCGRSGGSHRDFGPQRLCQREDGGNALHLPRSHRDCGLLQSGLSDVLCRFAHRNWFAAQVSRAGGSPETHRRSLGSQGRNRDLATLRRGAHPSPPTF